MTLQFRRSILQSIFHINDYIGVSLSHYENRISIRTQQFHSSLTPLYFAVQLATFEFVNCKWYFNSHLLLFRICERHRNARFGNFPSSQTKETAVKRRHLLEEKWKLSFEQDSKNSRKGLPSKSEKPLQESAVTQEIGGIEPQNVQYRLSQGGGESLWVGRKNIGIEREWLLFISHFQPQVNALFYFWKHDQNPSPNRRKCLLG